MPPISLPEACLKIANGRSLMDAVVRIDKVSRSKIEIFSSLSPDDIGRTRDVLKQMSHTPHIYHCLISLPYATYQVLEMERLRRRI
jgi:hypothetical protein